jgi:hypothetical protein
MTTLAAKPAGTQGDSSACNIHHKTKNKAAAAAAAAVMYPEVDGERANLFFRGEKKIAKIFVGKRAIDVERKSTFFLSRRICLKPARKNMNPSQSIVNLCGPMSI